ncbi:putative pectate lyase F [Colletotrichum sp. SAR11_240]|nr:putative pectate lyase F [Colletotrichum sp. SAR11_240]
MQIIKFGLVPLLAAVPALACNGYTGGVPKATGTVSSKSYIEIKAGQVYDGKWQRFDRGSGACGGQSEGDYKDAVFYIQAGGTLKNAIIGKNQAEGVHCNGHCTLEFVWFEDVCEDAISIKNDKAGTESWIIGGGAYHASDKVIQHNGCGTVNIINYYVEDYGKLYRSCGNCKTQCKRNVYLEVSLFIPFFLVRLLTYHQGVTAKNGGELAGINANYKDTATLKNVCADAKTKCQMYNGCAGGCEPSKAGTCSG